MTSRLPWDDAHALAPGVVGVDVLVISV
jgi:hypothetical protein